MKRLPLIAPSYYESNAREQFTSLLALGVAILDLGCDSGRDTLAFLKANFKVTAMDCSLELGR